MGLFSRKKEDTSAMGVLNRKITSYDGEYYSVFRHGKDEDKSLAYRFLGVKLLMRNSVFGFLRYQDEQYNPIVDEVLKSNPEKLANSFNATAFGFMLGELAIKNGKSLNREKIIDYIETSDLDSRKKDDFIEKTNNVLDFYEDASGTGRSKAENDQLLRETGQDKDRALYYSTTPGMAKIIYGMFRMPYKDGMSGDSTVIQVIATMLPMIELSAVYFGEKEASEARVMGLIG